MRTLKNIRRPFVAILMVLGLVVGLSACESPQPSSQRAEAENRQGGYDILTKNQPGETMSYSPTRDTINFWVNTWDEAGKASYVYLQNADGKITGYYILEGLPVSYCAAISPTYEIVEDQYGNVVVPAPANDGVYYSGGQCDTYYGKDATSGAYIEYTVGLGINVLLYDQPLPGSLAGDAVNLSPTAQE